MSKIIKTVTKITTQEETVKIEADTVLYFKIDYKEKKIVLISPNDGGSSYFSPLMKDIDIKNHEKFLKTYSIGIEYCRKMLKSFGIKSNA